MNASGIRVNLLRDFLEKATGVSRKQSVDDGDGVQNGRVMDGVDGGVVTEKIRPHSGRRIRFRGQHEADPSTRLRGT